MFEMVFIKLLKPLKIKQSDIIMLAGLLRNILDIKNLFRGSLSFQNSALTRYTARIYQSARILVL